MRSFAALVLMVSIPLVAFAGGAPEDSGSGIAVDDQGVAVHGADVVAYFDLPAGSEALIGSEQYSHQWRGATWYFASAKHRDQFAENPEAYAPEYGGYCAFAMASDDLVDIDPDAWTIYDGQLYLNYDSRTKARFESDHRDLIQEADSNWRERLEELDAQ